MLSRRRCVVIVDSNTAGCRGRKRRSRILVIAARCEPASTARTEFLDHLVAVERTRKPVTLSSVGPPPAPDTWMAGSLLCPDDLRTSLCPSLFFIPSAPVDLFLNATFDCRSQPLSRSWCYRREQAILSQPHSMHSTRTTSVQAS